MTDQLLHNRKVVPIGTQVVIRRALARSEGNDEQPRGSVGVVVVTPESGESAYLLRFGNGVEAWADRREFSIRKHMQQEVLRPPTPHSAASLSGYVIYRCVVGSRAYGLDGPGSDADRRGIYLPPAEAHWSLGGVPEQLENEATQECYWERQTFHQLGNALIDKPTGTGLGLCICRDISSTMVERSASRRRREWASPSPLPCPSHVSRWTKSLRQQRRAVSPP